MLSRGGGRAKPVEANGIELFSWFFFRVSGLLLVILAILHVVIMHVVNTVDKIDFEFVADRWGSPFWRVFDFLLLALALLHGINGGRVSIEDYIRTPGWRIAAHTTLAVIAVVFLILGGLAIVTFNPQAFQAAQAGR
ncbi:MAG TPA: succinate dehydrogenase, hydrophobic membrane anchor protein [Thermomicrobiales bacterium]|jgi:succinate dehydrogenase / fumarate reductase membrane anchor subunit|nr:succinate dehydrogenase, hydrophobic membrane anchor protein [Chloroflexota bacterium]HQX62633.1 succinate dehydrogenase, hydrophobic membrane anchor protein [Thermomicrobiales bacterium]HBY44906.1 succinate dehydrogenase, hydrophobic membrane anchor protein [Chloroflexota bacterium]HCG28492.1 succinate dehydrogenase, hydrophobic membrane anchor protein [Chloroflexota bacterium]HQZ88670.1 succinate dehydrogenase, hydrophobic membrane anchor protein [Thermomicrobiales bacterium]